MGLYESAMIGTAIAALVSLGFTVFLFFRMHIADIMRCLKRGRSRRVSFVVRRRILEVHTEERISVSGRREIKALLMEMLLILGGITAGASFIIGGAGQNVRADELVWWEDAETEWDTEGPTAVITMTGSGNPDGNYYYRSDNCSVKISFYDHGRMMDGAAASAVIDGREETRKYAETAGCGDELYLTYSAREISGMLADGFHVIEVAAEDSAGNVLEANGLSAEGVRVSGCGAEFVLDTIAPAAGFTVVPDGAENTEIQKTCGRYFFNSGFEVRAEIEDAYPDRERSLLRRGFFRKGEYDSSAAEITDYPEEIRGTQTGTGLVFRSAEEEEGVYRYQLIVCDKAGNESVYGSGLDEYGRSSYVVIDRTDPQGIITVESSQGVALRIRTDGTVLYGDNYVSGQDMKVTFSADVLTEHSPVTLEGTVDFLQTGTGKNGQKYETAFGTAVYAASKSIEISGEGRLKLSVFQLTDLAGNVTDCSNLGELLIDSEEPVIEEFCSGILPVTASIYNSAVPLKIRVRDGSGEAASGVGDVILRVYRDNSNEPVVEKVLHRRAEELYEVPAEVRNLGVFETEAACESKLDSDDLRVVLTAADNAGNVTEKELRFGIDAGAPEVTVAFESEASGSERSDSGRSEAFTESWGSAEGKRCFRSDTAVIISVRERHFRKGLVRVEVNGEEQEADWQNEEAGVWKTELHFTEEGEYRLAIHASDELGNETEKVFFEEGAAAEFVIDKTAPVLRVFLRQEKSASSAAAEANGDSNSSAMPEQTAESGLWAEESEASGAYERRWEADSETSDEYVHLGEEDYGTECESGRLAGAEEILRIDGESELYLNENALLVIEVEDDHFGGRHTLSLMGPAAGDEIEIMFEGKCCEIPINEEGTYELKGSVSDLAGNNSDELESYVCVLDRTAPVIEFAGVENGSSNRTIPAIRISVKEAFPEETAVMISSGEAREAKEIRCEKEETEAGVLLIPQLPSEDGIYRLRCIAADRAENTAAEEIQFAVNQNGAVFEPLEPELIGKWSTGPITPAYRILDVDAVTVLSAAINGREAEYVLRDQVLEFTDPLSEDGKYTVTIAVRDAAGYESAMDAADYYIDNTSPNLTLEISGGRKWKYVGDVEIALIPDDPDCEFVQLELDGESIGADGEGLKRTVSVSGKNTGKHILRARMADQAGNKSEPVEVSFTIVRSRLDIVLPFILIGAAAGLAGFYLLHYIRNRRV